MKRSEEERGEYRLKRLKRMGIERVRENDRERGSC